MNRSNTTSFTIRLLMFVFSIALFGADSVVSAQNTNSSTTTPPEDTATQNENANANTNRGGRRRRGRRRGGSITTGQTAIEGVLAPGQELITDRPVQMPVQKGRCDPNTQEQTDLSGTYTGSVNYAEGGMSGDATLTVSGNNFTLTSGSSTQEGRIVAVTTCNYTAVTMRFGKDVAVEPSATPPPPLPTISLRAKRTGGGLSLTSVEGETRQFSFSSSGAGGGGKTRAGRRGARPGSPPPVGIKPPTAMSHNH